MSLDELETLSVVPSDWPVNAMSIFLSGSLRRLLHSLHEGTIVKNLSAGQNLEVADQTWAIIREEGAVVEEALEDGDDRSSIEKVGEKDEVTTSPTDAMVGTSFNEKSGSMDGRQADVVEINPDDCPIKDEDGQSVL